MHALAVSTLIFAIVFGGAIAGMALRRALPEEHFGTDAKGTVRLAIGLVGTMTGLVLGMLVSSAKAYYDGQKNVVAQMSSQVILLDTLLVDYGPAAKPIRREVHEFVGDAVERIWPSEDARLFQLRPRNNGDKVRAALDLLVPKDERQTAIKARIESVNRDLRSTYWLMYLESEQASVSIPLLLVVTSWLIAIFVSFGIFASEESYGDGDADRLRDCGIGRDLHHYGDVLAVQWSFEDFSCRGPRCLATDGRGLRGILRS
jgi:hypothetical protein